MTKNKINNHTVLLVKKAEAKKGALWNDLTNQRIFKQHGGHEIPDNDAHAIPKYSDPVDNLQRLTPEETKSTLDDLANRIKHLQDNEKPASKTTSENSNG